MGKMPKKKKKKSKDTGKDGNKKDKGKDGNKRLDKKNPDKLASKGEKVRSYARARFARKQGSLLIVTPVFGVLVSFSYPVMRVDRKNR